MVLHNGDMHKKTDIAQTDIALGDAILYRTR